MGAVGEGGGGGRQTPPCSSFGRWPRRLPLGLARWSQPVGLMGEMVRRRSRARKVEDGKDEPPHLAQTVATSFGRWPRRLPLGLRSLPLVRDQVPACRVLWVRRRSGSSGRARGRRWRWTTPCLTTASHLFLREVARRLPLGLRSGPSLSVLWVGEMGEEEIGGAKGGEEMSRHTSPRRSPSFSFSSFGRWPRRLPLSAVGLPGALSTGRPCRLDRLGEPVGLMGEEIGGAKGGGTPL